MGVLAGIVGYFLPEVLGGGHFLVENVLANKVALEVIPVLFIAKFLLTIISYSAGVPGGIFLPLLVLGTLIGSFLGQINGYLFPNLQGMAPSFAIISMAAYFVAIVRAPLTGIVLIIEMTKKRPPQAPPFRAGDKAAKFLWATIILPLVV